MLIKRLLLAVLAVVIIYSFFQIDFYNEWFAQRITANKDQIFEFQTDSLRPEFRREYRYGEAYMLAKDIEAKVNAAHDKNAVVLLPPNAYIEQTSPKVAQALRMPEPVVFYYYTGLEAVWTNSPNVQKADWALVIAHDDVQIVHLENKQQLNMLLNAYKNYKAEL